MPRFARRGHVKAAVACKFQESGGRCFTAPHRGVCARPPDGGAAALIQHADFDQLCLRNPPHGFRALCKESDGAASIRMLKGLRDPARCRYKSCALVGSGGSLLGARLGKQIDSHDAVLRINFAPDGYQAARMSTAPHTHLETWLADVGGRTTWRVMAMEGVGYLTHYSRFWLQPPKGHGTHANMSGVPQEPLLAIACHTPTNGVGRCRGERLSQTFAHAESSSYLVNPLLLHQWSELLHL